MAKIELEQERYEDLILKEERLVILENAVKNCNPYSTNDLATLQRLFNLNFEID